MIRMMILVCVTVCLSPLGKQTNTTDVVCESVTAVVCVSAVTGHHSVMVKCLEVNVAHSIHNR